MSVVIYLGLFASAFLAATIFPAQSELSLAALVAAYPDNVSMLLLVATAGNSLGSAINWLIGRWCDKFKNKSWYPATSLDKARIWYSKYGHWSLFLSWAPVIGDPLTLLAGIMRVKFRTFFLLVCIAKFTRYLVVIIVAKLVIPN